MELKVTRTTAQRTVVYIESNELYDLQNKWFENNQIFKLKIKSKSLRKISFQVNKIIKRILSNELNIDIKKIIYSDKAGCCCGCSPGFIIKNPPIKYERLWIIFNINNFITKQDLIYINQLINSKKISKILFEDFKQDYANKLKNN